MERSSIRKARRKNGEMRMVRGCMLMVMEDGLGLGLGWRGWWNRIDGGLSGVERDWYDWGEEVALAV